MNTKSMKKSVNLTVVQGDTKYCVRGYSPTEYYLWVCQGKVEYNNINYSGWLGGSKAFSLYFKLAALYKKDKVGFIDLINREMVESKKGSYK